ncbi:MAG: hypothetical protein ACLFU8_05365 [Anaerolineales bacterium]
MAAKKAPLRKRRPWAVTALSLLLLLEALILGGTSALLFFTTEALIWTWEVPIFGYEISANLGVAVTAAFLALLALITAPLFFHLRPRAWVLAMLIQGMTLFVCIYLYMGNAMEYVEEVALSYLFYLLYFIMAYGIFMVIYLNHTDVQLTFRTRSAPHAPYSRAR